MAVEQVRDIIHREYGLPTEDVFLFFEPEPVAAATVSQVR
jgi:predicted unusual protein kinase regulating ubiquinone biosynthesis (AarF/ABC1/UbiB family)